MVDRLIVDYGSKRIDQFLDEMEKKLCAYYHH